MHVDGDRNTRMKSAEKVSLLTHLSDSQIRAFRHTATSISLHLVTELVEVHIRLSRDLEKIRRQFECEQAKSTSTKAADRLELTRTKRSELGENTEEVSGMIQYLFNARLQFHLKGQVGAN